MLQEIGMLNYPSNYKINTISKAMNKTVPIKNFVILILILVSSLFVASCSDDPASGLNPEEVPTPPRFEDVRMDLSAFNNTPDQAIAEVGNHHMAATFANAIQMQMDAFASFPMLFFNEESWGEAEMVNGVYTWEYSFSVEGESMVLTVTAEEQAGGGMDWQLRYSLHTAEESIDDALFIRAVVSADGQEGYWEIYDIETGAENGLRMDYRKNDGAAEYISIKLASNSEEDQIVYEVNGSQAELVLTNSSGTVTTEISWDIHTGVGYIISNGYNDGQKSCWDESYQNTACG